MTTDPHSTDSFPYPDGSVVGIVPDSGALDDAHRRLAEAGFDAGRSDVLHGEEGLARLDVDGAGHGRSGSLLRRLQSAFSDDADHVRRYARALEAGQYVIGVRVGDDEAAKDRAAGALRASPTDFLHYYAENYVEDLDAS
jgi:hypothetical protein